MKYYLAACLFITACGAPAEADGPVDMYRGASTILIHRPQPVGTRVQAQGVFRRNRRLSVIVNGFVGGQENANLQLIYDVNKTLVEVDLSGNPKRMRYDVTTLQATDADLPPVAAMREGRVVRLQEPGATQMLTSGGQSFSFDLVDGQSKLTMIKGQLTKVESEAFTDRLGPGYELGLEAELARMFGPKHPQREGNEWDIDLDRARDLLIEVGELGPPMKITGKATFVGFERIGDVQMQRVEAWIRGEGSLKLPRKEKVSANNNRVELKYSGLFPVDLSLPPVEHFWSSKAKGQVVLDVGEALGDIQFEQLFEHRSRIVQVRR